MGNTRLHYRRRHPYNCKSNRVRISKTPGGRLQYIYRKKSGTQPVCPGCKTKLIGMPIRRPKQLAKISRTQKRVNRAYGGEICGCCLRERILRAFLREESRIVKTMNSISAKKS